MRVEGALSEIFPFGNRQGRSLARRSLYHQDFPERENDDHLTQRELAELAGVGVRFVSELERGKPSVRLDAVERVLAVFGKRLGVVDAPRDDLEIG